MIDRDNTGLLIVDIQGKLARLVDNSEALIANCGKLIEGAQALSLPIVWLEQNPDKLGRTVPELAELLTDHRALTKFTFDGCLEPVVLDAMRGAKVDNWLVCGIETHICVYQTSSHLQQLGYQVQLVQDCVSSRLAENRQLGIQRMANQGVHITSLEMCLYELVKDCRLPEFKHILKLIK